jgi:hypothetical protein
MAEIPPGVNPRKNGHSDGCTSLSAWIPLSILVGNVLAPDSTRSGLRTAMTCVLLFGGTLLLFSRATGFEFVNYDDPS